MFELTRSSGVREISPPPVGRGGAAIMIPVPGAIWAVPKIWFMEKLHATAMPARSTTTRPALFGSSPTARGSEASSETGVARSGE